MNPPGETTGTACAIASWAIAKTRIRIICPVRGTRSLHRNLATQETLLESGGVSGVEGYSSQPV